MHRIIAVVGLAALAGSAAAAPGLISTDRFGYNGEVVRYDTLSDAMSGTNPIDNITIGDRDLALFVANGDTSVADQNVALGSWWYTMDEFYGPGQGRAGWGNTRGNTGVGFMQLYDNDSSTDTSVDMSFGDFDGTHYTSFTFSLTGESAGADDFSRFSAIDNVNDGGIWHEYAINLTATGLQGVDFGNGIIEATNHPTGVTGSITGIFEITENQTSPDNQGFYVVDLNLSMTNWAWENRNDLTPQVSLDGGNTFFDGSFSDSTFRTVPAPGVAGLLGLAALGATRRRRA